MREVCKPSKLLAAHQLHQQQQQQINHVNSNSCCVWCKKFELRTSCRCRQLDNEVDVLLDFCGGSSPAATPNPLMLAADDTNNNIVIDIDNNNFSVNRIENVFADNFSSYRGQQQRWRRGQKTTQRRRWTSCCHHFQATARGGGAVNCLFALIFNLVFCFPNVVVELCATYFIVVFVAFFAAPHLIGLTRAQTTSSPLLLPPPPPVVDSFAGPSTDVHHETIFYPTSPTGVITDYYDYESNQPSSTSPLAKQHLSTTAAAVTMYDSTMENVTMNYFNLSSSTFSSSSSAEFSSSSTAASHFELFNHSNASNDLQTSSSGSTPIFTDFTSSSASPALLPAFNATAHTLRWLLTGKNSSALNRASLFNSELGTFASTESSDFTDFTDPSAEGGGGVGGGTETGTDIKTLIVLSVLYGIISITAIVGNFFVIWIVATCRRMQSVTNYL